MPGSKDLTSDQLEPAEEQICRAMAYVAKLKDRMEARGWAMNDPLYIDTVKAHGALMALRMSLHYLASDAMKRENPQPRGYAVPPKSEAPPA